MLSKQAPISRPLSLLASRTLKIVGAVVVVGALLDIFILPIPYQFDRQWQIDFATQAVDRGVSLLVGLVLLLTGCWVDDAARTAPEKQPLWQRPRFYALVLSSLLGLFFVLLFPLHLNNVRVGNQEALTAVSTQVTQAQEQINQQIQTEISSRRQQIEQLIPATDEQLNQLVQNQQLTQEQANLIRQFKADPKSIEPFLKQQEDSLRTRFQGQIDSQQAQAQQKVKTEALKSGLRVGISSLLLAIGFIVIGWVGLRNLSLM